MTHIKSQGRYVKPHPSKEELRLLFEYFSEGGLLWKKRSKDMFKTSRDCNAWNSTYAGKVAGTFSSPYTTVRIEKISFQLSRLIWIYHHGDMPEGHQIDHYDQDKKNNRIENLRCVTPAENSHNFPLMKTNKTGVCGVRRNGKNFSAVFMSYGKKIYVGAFKDVERAYSEIQKARKLHNFTENHGKKRI